MEGWWDLRVGGGGGHEKNGSKEGGGYIQNMKWKGGSLYYNIITGNIFILILNSKIKWKWLDTETAAEFQIQVFLSTF